MIFGSQIFIFGVKGVNPKFWKWSWQNEINACLGNLQWMDGHGLKLNGMPNGA